MASIMDTLFGVSTERFQQERDAAADAQALAFARLDPFQQANFAIGRGANMLGSAIGGALGGQDPELQRVTMRQQIAGQLNPNDLSTFDRGIEMMRQGGDGQGAMLLTIERDKAQQQALIRGDQERVRQGQRAKDAQEATDFMNKQALQATVRGAFVPGTPAQEQFVEVDDQGQPVAIPAVPASFDLESIRAELLQTKEGRKKLEELKKLTQPEEFNLGDRRFRRDPNGNFEEVISATPPKPGITTRQLTTAEAQLRGLPAGKSYQVDSTGKVSQIGGGVTVKIDNQLKQAPDIVKAIGDFGKSVEPAMTAMQTAQNVTTLLNQAFKDNNSQAFEASRTTLAKLIGENKLSNEDIRRTGIDPRLVQGSLDFLNKKFVGVPNEDIMKQMFAVAKALEAKAAEKINTQADRAQAAAKASGFPGDPNLYFPRATPVGAEDTPAAKEARYQVYKQNREKRAQEGKRP